MKKVFHSANSRGESNYGWLQSRHTFSFAHYYNSDRMGFGVLRVINDDQVMGGTGFGEHSHKNMEIISIPLEGKLNHGDSIGNNGVIQSGEIQVMSAGKGIIHSEMNGEQDKYVKFLQIWVLPNEINVEPRYQQKKLDDLLEKNEINTVLSPHKNSDGVWVYQDVWFSIGKFDKYSVKNYTIHKKGNGVYIFMIQGNAEVLGQQLETRDGFGFDGIDTFEVKLESGSEILIMEVPMMNNI